MIAKIILSVCLFQVYQSKICWKECASDNIIKSVDVIGCKRRSTFPHKQNFRCDGTTGPPCFVARGETVHLDVTWDNPGVSNMTQSAVWVTWIDMPFVGLDTEGCPYLDGGQGCMINADPRESQFYFPIEIQNMFPTGLYDLKWKFWERMDDGQEKEIGCFLFTIKII